MASVKVAVRVRPFNQRERDMNASLIVNVDGKKTRILNQKVTQGKDGDLGRERFKDFTFDHSYWSFDDADRNFASQEMVFEDLGTDVIDSAFEGYNACVFAYGQTGSGKTFTMMGTPECQGLIPRICQTLFSRMAAGKDQGATYRTEVSYLEIYNERVKDLLQPGDSHALRVREHPRLGPYVQDLSFHFVADYEQIQELMHRGNMQRTTASTNMNNTSSRSHAIFTLTFAQAVINSDMMPSELVSKVHLVDLAGSERADTSGATGQRLKEGAHINKSLVTLGSVISALAELSANSAGPRRSSVFIPYRDSVLTWLLKDSLGGNSKTIMIAAISPADCNYGETLSTLRYANRAKNIINKPTINEDVNVKLIRDLREEISKLKSLLGGEFTTESRVLEQELHQMEAKEKVLTEEWTEKWRETQQILQEQKTLGLRKAGLGVVLDSDMPHLVGIDDDLLSTGVTLYHLRDGETRIGTDESNERQDIILNGNGVEASHCRVSLVDGVATLFPEPHAQCWVNTVAVDKPTKLSQGCIILLGRTNMFRYNDPVEAAKMRKEGSRSHLNLSRLSLLSFSTPDLAFAHSTENLSTFSVSEDPEESEELEYQRATLLKEREDFKREQAERESDWEREQSVKKASLETAQRELDVERQKMEQEYAEQCRQLAEDWRRLEKHQKDNLALIEEREAELNTRKEMLMVERNLEQVKVDNEYRQVTKLTTTLNLKKQEFAEFVANMLKQLHWATNGTRSNCHVKSLQLLAAEKLSSEKVKSPVSESSSESFASLSQEPETFKYGLNSHRRELIDLESEIRNRVSTVAERKNLIVKLDSELGNITESLEAGSNELKAMKDALSQRSQQQLQEISQKKRALSLDLKRTTSVKRPDSEGSSDLLNVPSYTISSSLDTGETFHTADSPCIQSPLVGIHARGYNIEQTTNQVNLSLSAAGNKSTNHPTTTSDDSEMSSTEDCHKRKGVSGNSTSSFEKVSPLSEIQNGMKMRRPRLQNGKYCRGSRHAMVSETVRSSPSVSQLMRGMKRLCQRVTHQKMLIMQSLENDCDKAELDTQIAVLQDFQRQYVRLEIALDQHPLRPLTLDNVGSSEDSDNMSTSADDAMSELMGDSKSIKLDNDYHDANSSSADGLLSPLSLTSYSAISSHDTDGLSSPSDYQPEFLSIPCYMIRGVGSQTHYEYEVRVCCSSGEHWSLLRRYKRFRELHLTMRLRYGAPVDALLFPPRVFFSKNSESVARRRRNDLEQYLRHLVDTCSTIPSCPLYTCRGNLTKMALLEFSAFFRKGVFETGKYGTS